MMKWPIFCVKTSPPEYTQREFDVTCLERRELIFSETSRHTNLQQTDGPGVYPSLDHMFSPPQKLCRAVGDDRLAAVLTGFAPNARTEYLDPWRHWGNFTSPRGVGRWMVRSSRDWGDVLIDFILLEARATGYSLSVVKGEISIILFGATLSVFGTTLLDEVGTSKC